VRNRIFAATAASWWAQAVSAVITGLLLLQYVLWIGKENGLWWPETTANVKITLGAVCLALIVPKLRWRLRAPLLAVFVLAANVMMPYVKWLPMPPSYAGGIWFWLRLMFDQMKPFVWFSLGAAIVYVFAVWWSRTKLRIYLWMIISILFFCIRDSFSTVVLWPQVAMVLFCGLLLLIVRHFVEFQRRAPHSWEHIAQYPSAVVLPIVLIMAVTVLLGIYTPTIRPLLTDPYTMWKHAKGEPVLIAGKGEISDWVAPAQDTSSGYSRNDRNLGGGFRFDYTPVFTVDTPERSYWRGETRSVYTGAGWEMSPAERRSAVTSAQVGTVLPSESRIDSSQMKTKEVVQKFTIAENSPGYPVLFAAKRVQKLQDVNGGAESGPLVWVPEQSELRFRGDKAQYPKEYTVVSQVPLIDEQALRAVNEDTNAIRQEFPDYLQLPNQLPQRVKDLAAQVTQAGATPYDKVKLLETYLNTNFKYTNTPDLSKGKSADFVDRFLFEMKEGYCDYFSTAMVVMTRSLGIPARWVKGYSSGSNGVEDQINEGILRGILPDLSSSGGTFTVRNSDAHSWVEVYFPGYGWIPFEPTAGFTMPVLHPEAAVEPAPAVEPTPVVPAPAQDTDNGKPLVLAIGIGAALLTLGAVAFVLWKLGALRRFVRNRERQAADFSQKVVLDFERLLRFCRRKGYRRNEHETIRETVHRWVKQSRWLAKDLETLLDLFEKAKYGKSTVSEEDYRLATLTMQKLRSQLK
jgi:transglutaminase-like putative cysteine protease